MTSNFEKKNSFGEVINLRDRDFFKFEEKASEIRNQYVAEHPDCDVERDEDLEKLMSNLLIENVKIGITDKGNISKTFCGHKLTENREKKTNTLIGISLTLYGNYENKKRTYNNLTTFNEWYEKKLKECEEKTNKTETKTEEKSSSSFDSVVFSIDGNDYCFEGLSGMKFVFKKNGDNGLKFELNKLVG